VNSLPKTVTRQRRDCDLNPGPSAPESSTLTARLPSHPKPMYTNKQCEMTTSDQTSQSRMSVMDDMSTSRLSSWSVKCGLLSAVVDVALATAVVAAAAVVRSSNDDEPDVAGLQLP